MRISATCLLHNLRGPRNVQAANIGHDVCMRGRVGRLETEILATPKEPEVLAGRAGEVGSSRSPTPLPDPGAPGILDLNSSVSQTYGRQERCGSGAALSAACIRIVRCFSSVLQKTQVAATRT